MVSLAYIFSIISTLRLISKFELRILFAHTYIFLIFLFSQTHCNIPVISKPIVPARKLQYSEDDAVQSTELIETVNPNNLEKTPEPKPGRRAKGLATPVVGAIECLVTALARPHGQEIKTIKTIQETIQILTNVVKEVHSSLKFSLSSNSNFILI